MQSNITKDKIVNRLILLRLILKTRSVILLHTVGTLLSHLFMSYSVVVAAEQSQKKPDTAAHLSPAVHLLDEGQRAFAVAEDRSPSRFEDATECLGLAGSIERDRFKVAVERFENTSEQV